MRTGCFHESMKDRAVRWSQHSIPYSDVFSGFYRTLLRFYIDKAVSESIQASFSSWDTKFRQIKCEPAYSQTMSPYWVTRVFCSKSKLHVCTLYLKVNYEYCYAYKHGKSASRVAYQTQQDRRHIWPPKLAGWPSKIDPFRSFYTAFAPKYFESCLAHTNFVTSGYTAKLLQTDHIWYIVW